MSKKSKGPRATNEPVELTTFVPADFEVTAADHTLNTDVLSAMSPEAIAYLLRVGFTTSMQSASFISKPDRTKMQAKGRNPDDIAAQRAKARFDAILSGTVTGRHLFAKKDPVERMIKRIADERVQTAIAEMPAKPTPDKVRSMVARLIELQADDLRKEAESRLLSARKIGSSLIERLMANGEDGDA